MAFSKLKQPKIEETESNEALHRPISGSKFIAHCTTLAAAEREKDTYLLFGFKKSSPVVSSVGS